jgi:hypothetical protein
MKLKHTKVATLAATLITFGSLAGGANAAVIFSQNGNDITLGITNESYTMTGTANSGWMSVAIFDVFSTLGESLNSQSTAFTATVSINGGAPTGVAAWGGWQYRTGAQTILDSNDAGLMLDVGSLSWNIGDTFLINGSVTMDSTLNSDIILPDLYPTNNISGLVTSAGLQSDTHAVSPASIPEPSSALLLGLGSLGLTVRRKRST